MKEVKNCKNEIKSCVFETVSAAKHEAIRVPKPGRIKLIRDMITATGLPIDGTFDTNSQTYLSTSSTTTILFLKWFLAFSLALSNEVPWVDPIPLEVADIPMLFSASSLLNIFYFLDYLLFKINILIF